MAEEKKGKLEREYVIPLRKQVNKVPRYKRANKAIKTIKEFLVKHMKIRDGDLKKIKIDKYLNEEVWFRGIKKPPQKIKVKVIKEGDIVRVELFEFKDKLKFKKAREDKKDAQAEEVVKAKQAAAKPEEPKEGQDHTQGERQNAVQDHAHPEEKTQEEKKEEQEKKSAVVEAGQKMEKSLAKKAKHETPRKEKIPKHKIRKTLAK